MFTRGSKEESYNESIWGHREMAGHYEGWEEDMDKNGEFSMSEKDILVTKQAFKPGLISLPLPLLSLF